MLQLQIVCHTFPCLYQLRETRDIPQELGLFYVTFLTVPLYIQWDVNLTPRVPRDLS